MSARVLDGTAIAGRRLELFSKQIADWKKEGAALTLGTVRVGDSKGTLLYAGAIDRLTSRAGVRHKALAFKESITQAELRNEIANACAGPELTGLLIFSPLPAHLDSENLINAVDILKDVEGRRILGGMGERVVSPTAAAVMVLLEETGEDLAGKEAVVVGRSEIVGKPAAMLLVDKHATVTVCHSKTRNLEAHLGRADIVVATVGKPEFIRGRSIKPGALVIDVGENTVNGKLVGDVEFEAAARRASWISPVPKGVGPVTNAMLIQNLMTLHRWKSRNL
jgi:methylenetetrahydrofolate dehydrogenase (NADP+)/methenyltetrahydrofolate cyclohydrolase